MKKKYKDYTKKELDDLLERKHRKICDKYEYGSQYLLRRDELLEWHESKLKLLNK